MVRAIALGVVIVVSYTVVTWTGLRSDWFEFALLAGGVAGIGAIVGLTHGDRPFLKAAVLSFMTILSIGSLEYARLTAAPLWAQPAVLPPPLTMGMAIIAISLMMGALGGAVALGLRSLQGRTGAAR